jgi:hypothetical protein
MFHAEMLLFSLHIIFFRDNYHAIKTMTALYSIENKISLLNLYRQIPYTIHEIVPITTNVVSSNPVHGEMY